MTTERVERERKAYPLPEALPADKQPPSGWVIRPSVPSFGAPTGSVSVGAGVMNVPLEAEAKAACIRAHEMGHARWSPAQVPAERDPQIMQAVEDARIHLLLTREAGVDLSAGLIPQEAYEQAAQALVKAGADGVNVRGVVLSTLQTKGTGDETPLIRALCHEAARIEGAAAEDALRDAFGIMERAHEMLAAKPKRFATAKAVAEWLESMLATRDEAERRKREAAQAERRAQGAGKPAKAQAPSEARGVGAPDAQQGRVQDSRDVMENAGQHKQAGKHDGQWGPMTVEVPPMPRSLPKRVRAALKGRPSDEGVRVKHWARWMTDRRVFDAPKARRKGTVLIDHSGSMSLPVGALEAILEVVPAATVASYSGNSRGGVLRLLARRGKRVNDTMLTPPGGGGNTVDGPALRWLAKQEAPRMWVSDGHVHGLNVGGGSTQENLYVECARICRSAGIVRVAHPRLVPDVLRRGVRV